MDAKDEELSQKPKGKAQKAKPEDGGKTAESAKGMRWLGLEPADGEEPPMDGQINADRMGLK